MSGSWGGEVQHSRTKIATAPAIAAPLLWASGLGFRYPGGFALAAHGFALARGEVAAVLGPNGAGKSTLLGLLGGLLAPERGEVLLGGAPVDRRRVGFVFQRPVVYRGSVLRNAAIGLELRGAPDARERALLWLERVGLAARALDDARTLSGGQVQRMALARALAPEPDLLLLDEPFAGLDALARRDLRAELLQRARGRAVVIVSHDPADLAGAGLRREVIVDGVLLPPDHPDARMWRTPERIANGCAPRAVEMDGRRSPPGTGTEHHVAETGGVP